MGYLGIIYIGFLVYKVANVMIKKVVFQGEVERLGEFVGLLASAVMVTLGILKLLQLLGVGL